MNLLYILYIITADAPFLHMPTIVFIFVTIKNVIGIFIIKVLYPLFPMYPVKNSEVFKIIINQRIYTLYQGSIYVPVYTSLILRSILTQTDCVRLVEI